MIPDNRPENGRRWVVPLLAVAGGGSIAVGAWLPWMSYFAGLVPLRGLIGINGRLLLGAGLLALGLAAALVANRDERARLLARRGTGLLGAGVVAAAAWLLIGVRELTRVHAGNAMIAPRPGLGLVVILAGGLLLLGAGWLPERVRAS